jgi:hypothetical protein
MIPTTSICDVSCLRGTVESHFHHLWPAVEVGLSTCATLLLADNVNPVAVIYVGPPSAGKTTVAGMFDGATICYRSDKFTPASFVSHSAKSTKKQLEQIDLLRRIRHKVLVTPELSTVFRGKTDELAERFSIITRVLDGQGFMSDSGTHGRRGYEGDHLFAWLGCTTPFDTNVWKVMAQLGSRMFFLVMDAAAEPTVEELVKAINQAEPYQMGLMKCRESIHPFLDSLFTRYGGVRGVKWNAEDNPKEVLSDIARCATLLATMRTLGGENGKPPQPESPHRANAVLYNLARGHALIHGRTQLTSDDLPMIAQVTVSSIPAERRAVLLALAKNEGKSLTVSQVEDATQVTRHTAERVMEELDWLGIMRFHKEGNGKPSTLSIKPEWAWCVSEHFSPFLLGTGTWQKSGDECAAGSCLPCSKSD